MGGGDGGIFKQRTRWDAQGFGKRFLSDHKKLLGLGYFKHSKAGKLIFLKEFRGPRDRKNIFLYFLAPLDSAQKILYDRLNIEWGAGDKNICATFCRES